MTFNAKVDGFFDYLGAAASFESFHEPMKITDSEIEKMLDEKQHDIEDLVRRFALYSMIDGVQKGQLDREQFIEELERLMERWANDYEERLAEEG